MLGNYRANSLVYRKVGYNAFEWVHVRGTGNWPFGWIIVISNVMKRNFPMIKSDEVRQSPSNMGLFKGYYFWL